MNWKQRAQELSEENNRLRADVGRVTMDRDRLSTVTAEAEKEVNRLIKQAEDQSYPFVISNGVTYGTGGELK